MKATKSAEPSAHQGGAWWPGICFANFGCLCISSGKSGTFWAPWYCNIEKHFLCFKQRSCKCICHIGDAAPRISKGSFVSNPTTVMFGSQRHMCLLTDFQRLPRVVTQVVPHQYRHWCRRECWILSRKLNQVCHAEFPERQMLRRLDTSCSEELALTSCARHAVEASIIKVGFPNTNPAPHIHMVSIESCPLLCLIQPQAARMKMRQTVLHQIWFSRWRICRPRQRASWLWGWSWGDCFLIIRKLICQPLWSWTT